MNKNVYTLLFLLFVFQFGSRQTASHTFLLNDKAIHISGRTTYEPHNGLRLITSASGASFDFEGDSCMVSFKNMAGEGNHGYAIIELDSIYYGRFKITDTLRQNVTIYPNKKYVRHHLVITKATEAQNGDISILDISSINILPEMTPHKHRIEFIGNSITCGMGSDTLGIPCGRGKWYDEHNSYYSYASISARVLYAEPMLSSVSGIGIYRCWNVDCPSMPEVYENLYLGTDSTRRWDFKGFTPDIVNIALGTNDFSDGDRVHQRKPFDSTTFITHYLSFIQTIYSHYPAAQIVLLTSPMLLGEKSAELYRHLNTIADRINGLKKNRPAITTFRFNPMHATGCSGHPTKEEHQVIADQLIPFLKSYLH